MKKIALTQGKYALVDNQDYLILSNYKWYAQWNRYTWYAARRSPRCNYVRHTIWMHREILQLSRFDHRQADHRNRNGLDNRRQNIHIVSSSENLQNRRPYGKTSKYPGVYWNKKAKRWYAQKTVPGIGHVYIGSYTIERKAAKAYKEYKQ